MGESFVLAPKQKPIRVDACFLDQHSEGSPQESARFLLCGGSNSGKTLLAISIILSPNGPKFANVAIISPTIGQAKYQFLLRVLEKVKGVQVFTFPNTRINLPLPPNTLYLVDDSQTDDLSVVRNVFSSGRHRGDSILFLCQSYTMLKKAMFKENVTTVVAFRQDKTSAELIWRDYASMDTSFSQFLKMCRLCWSKPHGFIALNTQETINTGKYSMCFEKDFQFSEHDTKNQSEAQDHSSSIRSTKEVSDAKTKSSRLRGCRDSKVERPGRTPKRLGTRVSTNKRG